MIRQPPSRVLPWALALSLVFVTANPQAGASRVSRSNVLGNASFEVEIGSGGADSGNWDNTNGALRVNAADAAALGITAAFPDGASGLSVPAGTFTFQVIDDVHAGDLVVFRGFAATDIAGGANGGRMKIEFKEIRGAADTLIDDTNTSGCINTGNASAAAFTQFTVSARAPFATSRVVFTLDRCGGAGAVVFDQMVGTVNGYPIDLNVEATKNRIPAGGASFVTIGLNNQSAVAQANVELVVNVPAGLTLVDNGTRLNHDIPTVDTLEEKKFFRIGTLAANDDRTLSFLVTASAGAVAGHRYSITLFARNTATGIQLSQLRNIPIDVILDPFFDEGTIIGKVFDDRNENGMQDEDEIGISGVRLATEEGIVILTDRDGKYHIPGVRPGRHVVKIDGHSLPQGTEFITEESYLVKITEGLMGKVDFAVKLPESKVPEAYRDDLAVVVSQGGGFKRPTLNVRMQPELLRIGQGLLEEPPVFLITTNYSNLISSWKIEVRDERGEEIWNGYGLGTPPPNAPWNGHQLNRKVIEPGVYSYRLVVKDAKQREDWTPLQFFRAVSKTDPGSDLAQLDAPETGYSSIYRQGKRSIPVVAKPTVLVRGQVAQNSQVEVNGQAVYVKPDGTFEKEIFTDTGDQTVYVRSTTPDGRTLTYHEDVKVKDTEFFMVALGEEELGQNSFNGNLETVGRDDKFHQGFFQKGRLAYYLKGKIKGKFLVSSRYDTTHNPRSQLFTNLDPESYYPVYGDDSEINYDARDTQSRLYLLVEMDRSYAKWGSFETNFNQTDLATYNRTLNGLKAHYEVLDSTSTGESKRAVTVFTAKANQLGDHNEFAGTGGSLYYLRNQDVVEGSEKVKIEIRDKIQGITVSTQDLSPVSDYEIDYRQGRIVLKKPLSSVAYSDTILSNHILDGSQVYLVVDYEFEAQDLFGDQPAGLRGHAFFGDHVRVGGTALKESRQDTDYDLRGTDVQVRVGKNTKISAEYAVSKNPQVRNAVSYNGGITFKELISGDKPIKKDNRLMDPAWLIKAESKPFKQTEVSGYIQNLSKGFSNATLISQKGDQKGGVELKRRVGKHFETKYRYDRLRNRDATPTNTPEITEHTLQAKYDQGRYVAIGEYRHQNADVGVESSRGLEPVFARREFEDGLGAKLGYRLDNGWMPYVKGQVSAGGKPNQQAGGGIEANIKGKGSVVLEEMAGNLGDSTRIGFQSETVEGANVYSSIQTGPRSDGAGKALATTIGSSYQVNEKSRVFSERELSTYEVGEKAADVTGYDFQINDEWRMNVSGERSRIRDLKTEEEIKSDEDVANDILNVERTAGSIELDRHGERLKTSSRFELRLDRGDVRRNQWFTVQSLDWKISEDYRFLAKLNQSMTIRTSDEGNRDGNFTELNAGLAYRPVWNNRLNVLTRYTWLRDFGVPGQFASGDHNGVEVSETSQILGLEGVYDFSRLFGIAQKLGYKFGGLRSGAAPDWIRFGTFLTVTRLNFHVTRKWDIAAEYRIRFDTSVLDSVKSGILLELDREIMDYIRFGVGYNFTDFSDDLRYSNSYTNHGWFTRLSGKF